MAKNKIIQQLVFHDPSDPDSYGFYPDDFKVSETGIINAYLKRLEEDLCNGPFQSVKCVRFEGWDGPTVYIKGKTYDGRELAASLVISPSTEKEIEEFRASFKES